MRRCDKSSYSSWLEQFRNFAERAKRSFVLCLRFGHISITYISIIRKSGSRLCQKRRLMSSRTRSSISSRDCVGDAPAVSERARRPEWRGRASWNRLLFRMFYCRCCCWVVHAEKQSRLLQFALVMQISSYQRTSSGREENTQMEREARTVGEGQWQTRRWLCSPL